jgi:hypothetical protein
MPLWRRFDTALAPFLSERLERLECLESSVLGPDCALTQETSFHKTVAKGDFDSKKSP